MSLKLTLNNLNDISQVAGRILEYTSFSKRYIFYGEMGVGKTTLIKELSLQLGTVDIVSSPTFSIVNEYAINDAQKIYHFDFYRLENESEALDIGVNEYFASDNYCFIEWPERIPSLVEDDMIVIKIKLEGMHRIIEIII
ncbi:MAG: tRNA (adenosine(37)-N6)-threonylcarbamoyltransferase complex ATPase subunit type 1 TsaE [Flavobacteriales bacterium]|nr:tRNA (adenosine(37)-N6)-threonylcarbamoyltransferase complex ATPase subunit type 1 TsaE [Flavobacteriales bacterium]